jgi:hypothetical protein
MNILVPWVKFGLAVPYRNSLNLYIKRLKDNGITLDGDSLSAIEDFFNIGHDQGWLSQLRVFYLPVWGQDQANSINIINAYGQTAVFGAVNNINGQVKSAGGVMNFKFNVAQLSSSNCGCGYFLSELGAGNGVDMGATNGSSEFSFGKYEGNSAGSYHAGAGSGGGITVINTSEFLGFSVFNSTAAGQRMTVQAPGGSLSVLGTAAAASGPLPNLEMYGLGLNNSGSETAKPLNRGYCVFAVWGGLTHAQCDQMSQAVTNLEEILRA